MKTFKKFVNDKNIISAVLISQGKHSIPRDSKEKVPSVLISQGKHSIKKEDINSTKKTPWDDIQDKVNRHIGKNLDDVHETLHVEQPFNNLSNKRMHKDFTESNEIKRYSHNSLQLNGALHASHIHKFPLDDLHKKQSDVIDSALKRHKLKKPLTVFSGVKFHPDEEASKNTSRHIHLPAYTSTSLSPPIAVTFSKEHKQEYPKSIRHVLKIHVPEGHHGLYIGDHSYSGNEHEFLMPRNTTLKIGKHPEIHHDEEDKNREIHMWDAHVVPHEEK